MTTIDNATVDFTLNGMPVSVRPSHPHLLSALREELDVTSAKDGCSPMGQCGCCTVMIDGKVQISCTYDVAKVAGRQVTTLEGVDEDERTKYSDAFAACGGLQCGFCIPGIVMRAKAQVDKKGSELKRDDMARHLGAHLCRCTGYVKVLDAIEAVAQGRKVDPSLPGWVIVATLMTSVWRAWSMAPCISPSMFGPTSSPSIRRGLSLPTA
jgi:aldehyde oxidoreductase